MSVYFITCREIGFVKIGVAYDPFVRLATLQTAFPLDLKVEALVKGAHKREKEFHRQFAEHRARGEWFRICPEIEALIAAAETPQRPKSIAQKRRLYDLHGDIERLGPEFPPEHIRNAFKNPSARTVDESHTYGWGRHDIRKLIASGDIHFPFRVKEPA
jgi:hypothetical protein